MTKEEAWESGRTQIFEQVKTEHDGTDFEKAMESVRLALAFTHVLFEEGGATQ